jgi:hypothetical protein
MHVSAARLRAFLDRYRFESIIFCVAFILQIVVFLLHLHAFGNSAKAFSTYPGGGDAEEHLALAESLLLTGAFAQQENDVPGPLLETLRMPLYPSILAATLALTNHNYALTIIIQLIPASFALVVLYLFLCEFLPKRVAFAGSLLAAFDAERLIDVNQFGTESYFFLLLFAGMLFVARLLKSPEKTLRYSALAALMFGLATLTRYFAFFLGIGTFLFLGAVCLWRHWRRAFPLRACIKPGVVFIAVFLVVVLPWSIRNYVHFDTFRLSVSPQWNLYLRKVVRIYEYKLGLQGVSHDSITKKLEDDFYRDTGASREYALDTYYLKDFRYRDYFENRGRAVITDHYGLYLKIATWRFIPWTTDSALSMIAGYIDRHFLSLQDIFDKTGVQPFPHIFWAGRLFWIATYGIFCLAFVLYHRIFLSERFLPLLYSGALTLLTGMGAEWSFTTRHKLPFVLIFYGVGLFAVLLLSNSLRSRMRITKPQ